MFLDTWHTRTHGYREYELDVANNYCSIPSLDVAKQIVFLWPVFSHITRFVPKAPIAAVTVLLVWQANNTAYKTSVGNHTEGLMCVSFWESLQMYFILSSSQSFPLLDWGDSIDFLLICLKEYCSIISVFYILKYYKVVNLCPWTWS